MILSMMMKVYRGDTTPFPTSERINSKSFRVYLGEGGASGCSKYTYYKDKCNNPSCLYLELSK